MNDVEITALAIVKAEFCSYAQKSDKCTYNTTGCSDCHYHHAQMYTEESLREKSARENPQPCEYCANLSRYKGFGYAEYFHQTAADVISEISIDVKFCPNCGRELVNDER